MYNCRIRAALDDTKSPHGVKRLSGLLGTKGMNQRLDIQLAAGNVSEAPSVSVIGPRVVQCLHQHPEVQSTEVLENTGSGPTETLQCL